MKVFLVRHADADAEIPEGLSDEARPLTTKSRQLISHHFAALAPRMDGVSLLLASPLVRAVQTAQICCFALGYEGPFRIHRSLLPDMPVGALEAVLEQHPEESLVLVGHQPSMGAMAAHLLGLPSFPRPVHPGTVIALDRPDVGLASRLLFYAAPGQAPLEEL